MTGNKPNARLIESRSHKPRNSQYRFDLLTHLVLISYVLLVIGCGQVDPKSTITNAQIERTITVHAESEDSYPPEYTFYNIGAGDSLGVIQFFRDGLCTIDMLVVLKRASGHSDSLFLEMNDHLEEIFFTDLDNDGFNELLLMNKSCGSGGPGKIRGFTYRNNSGVIPIFVQVDSTVLAEISNEHHDHFHIKDDKYLIHNYPIYNEKDSNAEPTGGDIYVTYELIESRDSFFFHRVDRVHIRYNNKK